MYSCSWKGGFLRVGNMHNIPRVRIFLHQQYIVLRYMLYCALSYNQSAMLGAHIKSVIMNINATLSKCQMCVSCRSTVFWMWYSGNLWVSYDVPLFQISSELFTHSPCPTIAAFPGTRCSSFGSCGVRWPRWDSLCKHDGNLGLRHPWETNTTW